MNPVHPLLKKKVNNDFLLLSNMCAEEVERLKDRLMGNLVFIDGDYIKDNFTPVYRAVGELVCFADLLLRWPFQSFYRVSFFAGLEMPETPGDYQLHMRLARSIGLRYEDPENPKKTTLIIVLSDCAKYLYTYDFLLANADMLYFDRAQVEAIEAEHPECRIVDVSQRNRNPLFYTTPRNIRTVSALTLYHWDAIGGIKGEWFKYRDESKYPEQWGMEDTLHFPGKELPKLPKEKVWPDLPTELPEGSNYKRNNDLGSTQPLIEELRALGIRDAQKMAKIVYSFYPELTAFDIGTLFPVNPKATLDKQSIRDRGRTLLGKKVRKKATAKKENDPT